MQVSSTLIAAQQAAREAQARFQTQLQPAPPAAQAAKASFAAQLGEAAGFTALPLKQTATPQATLPQGQPAQDAGLRPGSLLDIKI